MKKEYIKLYGFMIAITLIVASLILVLTNSAKANKEKKIKEEQEVIDKIDKAYEEFKIYAEEFGNFRESYIKGLDEKTSVNTGVSTNYKEIIANADDYLKRLEEIETKSAYLYGMCYEKQTTYNKKATNKQCIMFLRNREQFINSYIEDIKYLNHRINEYNKWTDVNNSSALVLTKYEKVDSYKQEKYKDYVDLDDDGVYLGMNAD